MKTATIQNVNDRCPNGKGANEGWQSTSATDGDQDGCRDNDEDDDDDNDGIVDTYDGCPWFLRMGEHTECRL